MLKDLLINIDYQLLSGNIDLNILDICYDTKKMKENSLFICLKGKQHDGHQYIDEAIDKGAIAIIISEDVEIKENITYIKVANTRLALAHISAAFFQFPSHKMTVIGITGTKGKTTIAHMIADILKKADQRVGMIGTIGCTIHNQFLKTKNTTPESYEIENFMHMMVKAGCRYCIMEVSSQGLMMDRVTGIDFDYGIFTNLSSDHISENEHHSFDEYMSYKKKLFQMCQVGIFNKDDQYYDEMIKDVKCEIKTYSLHQLSDLQAIDISFYRKENELGVYFKTVGCVDDYFEICIPGDFNVYNGLAAIMLGKLLSIDMHTVKSALRKIQISGRNEIIPVKAPYSVIIDYAHNAFAVECLLKTLQKYHPHAIICVYGAGGHRDMKRRYDTGRVVAKYHAYSILTADNPRGEQIKDICHDIILGIESAGGEYIVIEDRKQAILYALDLAVDEDIILCFGKGHEDYQIIDQVPLPFSEKQIIEEYFSK